MKRSYILFVSLVALALIFGCKSAKKEEMAKITNLEKEINNSMNTKFDENKASEYIEACQKFAANYQGDTVCSTLLFKAGRLAMNLPQQEKANESIIMFDKLLEGYPHSKDAPLALFMKGFYLENNLKNIQKAEETYREFLRKYPNHQLAPDAKKSIEYLGKPLEQIIKEFKEKEKKDPEKDSAKVHLNM